MLLSNFDKLTDGIMPAVVEIAEKAHEKRLIGTTQLQKAKLPIVIKYAKSSELMMIFLKRVEVRPEDLSTITGCPEECTRGK